MAERKITVEDDLPAAWDILVEQLEDEAGLKLPKKQEHSLDQVMAIIRSADVTPGLASKTVDIISKAFTCVDRFGSMIVQASSIVFGPSAQMWNAVSFLINAAKDTKAVFENLAALMERTYIFLERLRGYLGHKTEGEKLDKQLRARFYAALEQFMRIMTLSYNLTHSWQQDDGGVRGKLKKIRGRVVAFVKVGAYGDDSGVKAAMADFEQRVSDISGVQIDIIHRDLSDAAKNICVMGETVGKIYDNTQDMKKVVDKLGEVQAGEKVIERVRKSLGIDDKKESVHTSAHNEYLSVLPGTASWLFEHSDYQEWADVNESSASQSILSIAAPAGYGKSFLAHTIIKNVNEKSQGPKQQTTVRVAWYYFQKEYKATDRALRHIIWELGQADAAYAQFLDKCKDLSTLKDPELWTRVVTQYGMNRPQPEAFFIILDGLENLDGDLKDDLTKILNERRDSGSKLQLRFLLTGPQSVLQEMQRETKTKWSVVDLLPSKTTPSTSLPHQEDIKRFIVHQLDRVQIFKNDTSEHTEDIKSRILSELPKAARGSYTHIEQQVRGINKAEDLAKVEQLLKSLDRKAIDIINDEIARLNRELEGARIHQLNEILAWVSVAQENLNVDTIRSVLKLKFKSESIKEPATWVANYCSLLLEVDSGRNDGDNSNRKLYLQFLPDVDDALLAAERTRDVVTDSEIDLIQAMLRTTLNRSFGSDTIFDRFEFKDFFEKKRTMQRHLVHLKPQEEASLTVLQTCLQAICDLHDDKRPEFESLRDYAREYFDEHIVLADMSKMEVDGRTQLGRNLYRLLKEDVVIDTWATPQHLYGMTEWFEEDNGACAAMVALLKEPDVQKSIQAVYTATDWLYAEKAVSTPNEDILQFVARRLLQRVYDDELEDLFWPIIWLRGYFFRAGSDNGKFTKRARFSESTLAEAKLFEKWARLQLKNVEDAKWHFFMAKFLSATARLGPDKQSKRHYRAARKRCETAFELDANNWAVQILRSQILFELKDYEECKRVLEVLQHTMTLGLDEKYDKAYWKTVVPGLGDCHSELKAYSEAAAWFVKCYHHNTEKDELSYVTEEIICKLLKAYREQNETQQALEIVSKLDTRLKDNKSWLANLLEDPWSDLHDQLILLARDSEAYTVVDTYYDKTIRDADDNAKKSGARLHLEYTKGRLHFYCGPIDTRKFLLPQWEILSTRLHEQDTTSGWWTRRNLVQDYTKLWISLSSQSVIEQRDQQELVEKLNKFSEINNDLNTYSLYREAKLALARVLSISGRPEEAREVLKPLIEKAIEQARTADEAQDGYERLAMILPVINDDQNALAAWSTLSPSRPKEKDNFDESDAPPKKDGVADDCTEPATTAGATVNGYASDGDDDQDDLAEDKKDTGDLVGTIGFGCDGGCGRNWNYADDMWVCRDCLCVQLDTGCHEKLKRGELPITICHSTHEYLHVPPFDVQAWKAIDPADVKVGSEVITREAWLAKLEQQWGIEKKEEEMKS